MSQASRSNSKKMIPSSPESGLIDEGFIFPGSKKDKENQKFATKLKSIIMSGNPANNLEEYEKSLKYAKAMSTSQQKDTGNNSEIKKLREKSIAFYQAQYYMEEYLNRSHNNVDLLLVSAEFYLREAPLNYSYKYSKIIFELLGSLTINLIYSLVTNITKSHIQPINKNQNYKNIAIDAAIEYYFNAKFILSRKEMPFNFIYCPKNACTSLKFSLACTYAQTDKEMTKINPHKIANYCLHENIDFKKEFVIVTRNPYLRFISAYRNKIIPGKINKAFIRICEQYGFNKNNDISMDQLLDALLQTKTNLIDGHFRPQSKIFCSLSIKPTKIFSLEYFNEYKIYAQQKGVKSDSYFIQSSSKNAPLPQDLERHVRSKIYRLYERDFILYGYSSNPLTRTPTHSKLNHQLEYNFLSDTDIEVRKTINSLNKKLFNEPFLRSKNYSVKGFINNLIS